jgi:hypothetical protein
MQSHSQGSQSVRKKMDPERSFYPTDILYSPGRRQSPCSPERGRGSCPAGPRSSRPSPPRSSRSYQCWRCCSADHLNNKNKRIRKLNQLIDLKNPLNFYVVRVI